jgi:hypothetical protein
MLTSRIEEVVESHVIQVKETAAAPDDDDEDDDEYFSHDIFEVFAAEKKKCLGKAAKLSAPPPSTTAPTADSSTNHSCPNVQFRYQSDVEDQQLISELEEYLMQGKLALTTPAHILTASPTIQKNITEKIKVRRVEIHEYEVAPAAVLQTQVVRCTTVQDDDADHFRFCPPIIHSPAFCLPLQEVDVLVNNSTHVPAILDTSSQINVIR